jgi:hypothetical protein
MREIARDYAGLGVTEIARTVCELLGWKRANGRLKDQECRQLENKSWPVCCGPLLLGRWLRAISGLDGAMAEMLRTPVCPSPRGCLRRCLC